MFYTKKGFTLVEMMVAILLSAIIIFFSYTLTISAYKMFSKTSKTSKNFNNIQFFEEVLKKSITEADRVEISSDHRRIECRRYDVRLGHDVTDVYSFESANGVFREQVGSHLETYPSNITGGNLFAPTRLMLRTGGLDILVLNNVRAFFYRANKIGDGTPHLQNISIGIVYEDNSLSVPRRQNRSFYFTMRNCNVEFVHP